MGEQGDSNEVALPESDKGPEHVDLSTKAISVALAGNQVRDLSGIEKAALYLAWAIFGALILVMAVILIDWFLSRVPNPKLDGMTAAEQKQIIDNFKILGDAVSDRTAKLFDLMVVKGLLPLLATLVGYLLGKRNS